MGDGPARPSPPAAVAPAAAPEADGPRGTAPPLIAVRNATKRFTTRAGRDVLALADVSLDVARDEFITFVGPSGCGKSTLLKLIGGFIPPSAGTVLFDGRALQRPSRDIGVVFQRPVLLAWRSVLDNILFPIEMLGWRVKDYLEDAHRLIELVGLRGFEHARPDELSGGMQHRVAICRTLVYGPQLLLMDEPFAALDAMTREELGLELLMIWSRQRKTIVFVTHSIPEAVLLADRVVVMTPRPGKVVRDIPIALSRPRTLDMLFTPQFKSYADAIRALVASSRCRE